MMPRSGPRGLGLPHLRHHHHRGERALSPGLGDLNADGLDLWGRDGLNDGWVGWAWRRTFDFAQTFDLRAINSGYVIALSQKAADIDGDGIVTSWPRTTGPVQHVEPHLVPPGQWRELRGAGAFAELDTATNALDLADLDGDGQPEVIGGLDDDGDAGQAYRMQVTLALDATVSGTSTRTPARSAAQRGRRGRVVVADWNRDGNLVVGLKDTDPTRPGWSGWR